MRGFGLDISLVFFLESISVEKSRHDMKLASEYLSCCDSRECRNERMKMGLLKVSQTRHLTTPIFSYDIRYCHKQRQILDTSLRETILSPTVAVGVEGSEIQFCLFSSRREFPPSKTPPEFLHRFRARF